MLFELFNIFEWSYWCIDRIPQNWKEEVTEGKIYSPVGRFAERAKQIISVGRTLSSEYASRWALSELVQLTQFHSTHAFLIFYDAWVSSTIFLRVFKAILLHPLTRSSVRCTFIQSHPIWPHYIWNELNELVRYRTAVQFCSNETRSDEMKWDEMSDVKWTLARCLYIIESGPAFSSPAFSEHEI